MVNPFLFLVFCCFSALVPGCVAQFRSTQWTADEGLPQNSVRGIVLTPDGYIWVATLNGVARFDGVRFVVFDKSNTPAITSNRIVAMVGGVPGDLWLASEDGNVIRYHEGKFIAIGPSNGVLPRTTAGLTSDGNGGVWILSGDSVYRWDEALQKFQIDLEDKGSHFRSLWWVGTGFWALADNQLRYLVRGLYKTAVLPDYILRVGVRAVAVSGEYAVWIATLDGKFYRMVDGDYQQVHQMLESPLQGRGQPGWKYQVQDNFIRTAIIPSGGFEKGIRYNIIARDKGGNFWIGSEGQGLYRIQQQSITVHSTPQGMAGANIYPVLKAMNGDMWIGTWAVAGITQVHNGTFKTFTKESGVPGLPTALAEDRDGRIWVGSHGGVRVLSKDRFVEVSDQLNELRPSAILQNADGAMMFGTSDGIYVQSRDNPHWLTAKTGLATNDVRVMIPAKAGGIWVGGYGGLTRVDGENYTRWTEHEGLPSNNVRAIYEDANGDLWVGTYDGGLGLLHNNHWVVFNKKNGLYDDGAFQILEDARQNLWMSSNRGIYRVSKTQLYSLANGNQRRIESIGYGRSDGMLSVECNGGSWPSGAKDDNGRLWFPTQDGVAVVHPELVEAPKIAPHVVIEEIAIDHARLEQVQTATMRPGQSALEIQYSALSFSKPEQAAFQYKLDGIDSDWEDVGQRRTAYYKHLPPGDYTFHLRAVDSDGIFSQAEALLPVAVIPPFYERWWFTGSIGLLVLAIGWAAWNFRIQQLQQTQAAQKAFSQQLIASQESERRRIAAELHDSLGQRLIVIKNLALFLLRARNKPQSEEDRLQTIQEISSEATAAMEETRSISYDLRPFQLDRLGLSKAIQGLLRTASLASGIEFSADLCNMDDFFTEDLRINFFRIIQESVNNIIKHSEATKSEIRTTCKDGMLQLTISDNGKGLSEEPRPVTAGPGGFGLTGISERANLLNGSVKIKSNAGVGTQLILTFQSKKESVHA